MFFFARFVFVYILYVLHGSHKKSTLLPKNERCDKWSIRYNHAHVHHSVRRSVLVHDQAKACFQGIHRLHSQAEPQLLKATRVQATTCVGVVMKS